MDILTVSGLDCVDKAAIQVFGLLLDVLGVCSKAYTHTRISWVCVFNNGGNRQQGLVQSVCSCSYHTQGNCCCSTHILTKHRCLKGFCFILFCF